MLLGGIIPISSLIQLENEKKEFNSDLGVPHRTISSETGVWPFEAMELQT